MTNLATTDTVTNSAVEPQGYQDLLRLYNNRDTKPLNRSLNVAGHFKAVHAELEARYNERVKQVMKPSKSIQTLWNLILQRDWPKAGIKPGRAWPRSMNKFCRRWEQSMNKRLTEGKNQTRQSLAAERDQALQALRTEHEQEIERLMYGFRKASLTRNPIWSIKPLGLSARIRKGAGYRDLIKAHSARNTTTPHDQQKPWADLTIRKSLSYPQHYLADKKLWSRSRHSLLYTQPHFDRLLRACCKSSKRPHPRNTTWSTASTNIIQSTMSWLAEHQLTSAFRD